MKRGTAITISLVVSILFAVFFIYPAGMVVKQAFEGTRPDGTHFFTLDFFASVFRNPIYREGLWNAFTLGIASTLATLAIAFPLALVGHRYDFFGKPALGVLVLAPMILPALRRGRGNQADVRSERGVQRLAHQVRIHGCGSPL